MIVVSDTSALTSLLHVNRADILARLYNTVLIPPAVHAELQVGHTTIPGFIQVVPVQNQSELLNLLSELHAGEAEAIVLAKERAADLLLIDETVGRRIAAREGLSFIGLLGVLVQAKRAGILESVRNLTTELERVAGFRVTAEVKELISHAPESRAPALRGGLVLLFSFRIYPSAFLALLPASPSQTGTAPRQRPSGTT
jgi:uncharacterized protein